jgi:hypothetical protein
MISSKEHLTEAGRLKIRLIASEMKTNKVPSGSEGT